MAVEGRAPKLDGDLDKPRYSPSSVTFDERLLRVGLLSDCDKYSVIVTNFHSEKAICLLSTSVITISQRPAPHVHGTMTTNQPPHTSVVVVASENVERHANLAWEQACRIAEGVPEPTIGRASGFLPTELCYKAMNSAVEEYPEKVRSTLGDFIQILSNQVM